MSAEMIGIVITAVSLLLAIWGLMARQTATLRAEINGVRTEMREGDAALRAQMDSGDAALRAELKVVEESLRTEMNAGFDALRTEMNSGFDALRTEMREGDESLRRDNRALGIRMDMQDQKIMGIGVRLDTLIDRIYSTELHPQP